MRLLGLALLFAGGAALVFAVRRTLASGRPADVAYGLLAWLSVVITLLGLALTFVPGFLH